MALLALANRPVMVREYLYTMDGTHTGTLFLIDSPRHPPVASWLSTRTGLRTPWHGSWRSPNTDPAQDLEIYFDYKGNGVDARRKPTNVRRAIAPGYQRREAFMTGEDYQLRQVTMQLTCIWQIDARAAEYVVR